MVTKLGSPLDGTAKTEGIGHRLLGMIKIPTLLKTMDTDRRTIKFI
jgi:hypothetical protein